MLACPWRKVQLGHGGGGREGNATHTHEQVRAYCFPVEQWPGRALGDVLMVYVGASMWGVCVLGGVCLGNVKENHERRNQKAEHLRKVLSVCSFSCCVLLVC
jgi:hypothetical protein